MASEEQTALSVAELQAQISELPAGRDRETERQRAMGFVELGRAQFNLGRDREAVDSLGEAERILSAMRGMEARVPEVALMRGELLGGRLREYAEALAATDRLVDSAAVGDMPDFVARVYVIRFTALRKLGRWAQASVEADGFLSRVQEPSASEREREVIRQAYYARSVAFMKRGDPGSALLAADAAIATARTLPADTKRLGSMLLLRAAVLEALGRRSDARAAYRDVVRQSRHDRDELARSQVKLARRRSFELLAGRRAMSAEELADQWGAETVVR